MTSVLRRTDQIGPRIRYLLVTAVGASGADSLNLSNANIFAFSSNQQRFGPVDQVQDGTVSSFTCTPVSLTIGSLYRDTGRSLYVYNILGAGGLQVAIFRQVIPMSGYNSEGISATQDSGPSLYVKVWSATGNGVVVSRTG
jgi:hypothetical protein